MLGEIINIGDIVTITIPKENREHGYDPCPDGTVAEVVGFTEIAWGRLGNYGYRPGVYENRCWVKLALPGGGVHTELAGRLDLLALGEEKRRLEELRKFNQGNPGWLSKDKFLRDLPGTPFWEGDFVQVLHPDTDFSSNRQDGAYQITRIEYSDLDRKRDGGSPYPAYTFSSSLDAGWTMNTDAASMRLVERGPVWKHYHGEPIEFASLKEEAELFRQMGRTEEVRNPVHNSYAWTLDEVLGAIRDGLAHGFFAYCFGGAVVTCTPIAVRYLDADLGARVAQATLEGFATKDTP